MTSGGVDGLQNAGITPKERLERIEAMLTKIDEKLDGKADAALVAAIEVRLRTLENYGPERVAHMYEVMDGRVTKIEQEGSPHARLAEVGIKELNDEVQVVKKWVLMASGGLGVLVFVINVAIAKGWI